MRRIVNKLKYKWHSQRLMRQLIKRNKAGLSNTPEGKQWIEDMKDTLSLLYLRTLRVDYKMYTKKDIEKIIKKLDFSEKV